MSLRSLRAPFLANRPAAQRRTLALVAALAVFTVILIRTAWMSDDAYITLRSVDNLVRGYGPTWNVVEHVQSFTHPLWMLVLSVVYFVTREAYFTTLVVSLILSLAALWLVMRRIADSLISGVLAAAVLILSKAFVDYSTSGLENPLTHLLLAAFFAVYFGSEGGRRKLFRLALLTALLAVNRIDAVLLVSLPLLLAVIENRAAFRSNGLRTLGLMLVGFLPFVAWELFSLIYYGFPAPNTAFAKLNTSIPEAALLRQGLTYLVQSTRTDVFTSLVIVAGSVAALLTRKLRVVVVVLAALLYVAYTVWIGGDFMSGRFLAAPLFCTVIAVVASGVVPQGRLGAGLLAVVLVIGIAAPYSPVWGDAFYPCGLAYSKTTGIDDERGCYFGYTGLVRQTRGQAVTPNHYWMADGVKARSNPQKVQLARGVGMLGYGAGPETYIVDLNALGDPLLARLPVPPDKTWRIGHFERLIPAGYLESLASGQNLLCNAGLRAYYDHLQTITRGPLFSGARLAAVWKMNTGQYEGLLAGYGNPDPPDVQLCNATARTDLQFVGGPKLVGYAVPTFELKPGATFPVTLYWQRDEEHSTALASFAHIRPSREGQPANPRSENGMWAQGENWEPAGVPSDRFWDGQVYADQFRLDIPADMPAGVYFFEIGWFNTQTHEQLEPQPETITPPYAILWRSVLLPPLTVQ